jgi:hypothetical protein
MIDDCVEAGDGYHWRHSNPEKRTAVSVCRGDGFTTWFELKNLHALLLYSLRDYIYERGLPGISAHPHTVLTLDKYVQRSLDTTCR